MTTLPERLPEAHSLLVVVAHPDDESFGLGAAIGAFCDSDCATSVLCFTHGEASTLGTEHSDLGRVRAAELAAAANVLGVDLVELLDYPDGHLAEEPLEILNSHVRAAIARRNVDLLLVFDEGGVTGHPDHCRATEAAVSVARELGVPVLAWALSDDVASTLSEEFSVDFVGRRADELDFLVRVDRDRQQLAIREHVSQATDNPVLARRLSLQGDREAFRWLWGK